MRPRLPLRMATLALLLCLFSGGDHVHASAAPPTRSGGEIVQRFLAHRAETRCDDASLRWKLHYAGETQRLAHDDVALALFGHVLDAVLAADLPSEMALIPFVESRYHPGARSTGGPAGLWQFTAATARLHGLTVRGGVDERLSAASATRSAVDYLQRLHRMFGRHWRQTVMAYNAGEGRLRAAQRGKASLSGITRSYPVKLHAIACLLDAAQRKPGWRAMAARPVPRLAVRTLPAEARDLSAWAKQQGLDPKLLKALNPGWQPGSRMVLAPVAGPSALVQAK